MNILITGNQGLAKSLGNFLSSKYSVTYASRSTGHNIQDIAQWAPQFYHYDMFVNSAYDRWCQTDALEQFYWAWYQDPSKHIINIGSTVSDYARYEKEKEYEYMAYRVHKQSLQATFAKLVKQAKCDIKLINPGAIDTQMLKHLAFENKMSSDFVAQKIVSVMFDPCIKRLDLWI